MQNLQSHLCDKTCLSFSFANFGFRKTRQRAVSSELLHTQGFYDGLHSILFTRSSVSPKSIHLSSTCEVDCCRYMKCFLMKLNGKHTRILKLGSQVKFACIFGKLAEFRISIHQENIPKNDFYYINVLSDLMPKGPLIYCIAL